MHSTERTAAEPGSRLADRGRPGEPRRVRRGVPRLNLAVQPASLVIGSRTSRGRYGTATRGLAVRPVRELRWRARKAHPGAARLGPASCGVLRVLSRLACGSPRPRERYGRRPFDRDHGSSRAWPGVDGLRSCLSPGLVAPENAEGARRLAGPLCARAELVRVRSCSVTARWCRRRGPGCRTWRGHG